MKTLIRQANILVGGNDMKLQDVLFDETQILAIEDYIDAPEATVLEAHGNVLLPGLIDVHVHLREPGYCEKETIQTGTMAAAHGGFTTIMAMPNVIPYPDDVEVMKEYLNKIKQDACVNVIPYACITKGEQGKTLVDMKAMKQLGIHSFSDDGVGVASEEIMEAAMCVSQEEDIMIVAHTEDMNYRLPKACVHEGKRSKELGLVGIPSCCESGQLLRDLKLVEKTQAHYHVCHMSAKESVDYLREYKAKGLDVSGEVTVHHLLLNEMDVQDDAFYKMNPPLRSGSDQEALLEGLLDGTIDMIANDHAPHTASEKAKGMEAAPFGIVAIETAFPLLYTHLVKSGKVPFAKLVNWMSTQPAKRFKMERKGALKIGNVSDMVLVDIHKEKPIDAASFYSKGKNTPFDGWLCTGHPVLTIVSGNIVYKEEKR